MEYKKQNNEKEEKIMLNKLVQTSMFDIYTMVQEQAENNKSEFIKTIENHLDFASITSLLTVVLAKAINLNILSLLNLL